MALVIVTRPAAGQFPVTLAEAKAHLRIDDTDSDAIISREIAAVADWLAGRNGWLGRSLIRQVLALTVPLPIREGFTGPVIGCGGFTGIALPRPPVIEVQTVEMLDGYRRATAISPTGFTTYDGDDGLTHLVFLPDFTWPVIESGPAFVRVTYSAGYGAGPADVDEGLRHAFLMAVLRLHEARGDPFSASLQDDPQIARMFAPYRVWTRS